MALWTDIITPAELTGYARESLAAYEQRKGTLAQFLPNREVADIVARFVAGQYGLVDEARYRAYDAEPEIGKRQPGKRVSIELPAVGQNIPVSEYLQLRTRNATDLDVQNQILRDTETVVQAVADRTERMRGTVLTTGKATIDQPNFKTEDDFQRDASHTVTAGTLWNDPAADPIGYLETLQDLYVTDTGDEPGAVLMSRRAFRAMQANAKLATLLVSGATRQATDSDVRALVSGAGLPDIVIYDRRTSAGRVIPDDRVFLLPAPVAVNDWQGTQLGATFWGQTLTSVDPDFGIEPSEQPGIVVGVYRNEKPPMIAEVISDAIALPVLANANLSIAAKVL
ncbi:major capsid protein [Nakamurella aerolata]|uniref:Major capsid protein E n=1 Tax=Nakamurella aerolata TaxID=1656892 RepID=A0A849A8Q3_9ACTN|nr:major capsid protein [Nakamurella aerolata]NNG36939.1 major capsid protein E [Nakamurella aerolata]